MLRDSARRCSVAASALVARVGVGVQEARWRCDVDALGRQPSRGRAARHRASSGCATRAVGAPCARRTSRRQLARHQRLGLVDEEVVELVLALAADLQRVAEARGGDAARSTAPLRSIRALVKSVVACTTRPTSAGGERALAQQARRPRRRRARAGSSCVVSSLRLAAAAPRAVVVDDDVGERAADVDPERVAHGVSTLGLRGHQVKRPRERALGHEPGRVHSFRVPAVYTTPPVASVNTKYPPSASGT